MKWTFKHMLLKRAYTVKRFQQLAAESHFKTCHVLRTPIGMEITLQKAPAWDRV